MTGPRTLSLVPDASAWMRLLGLEGLLVGGTDSCRRGTDLPACTRPTWRPAPVRALVPSEPAERDPGRDLDAGAVRAVDPELVIVDAWNESWTDGPEEWLGELLGHPVETWTWNVRTLRDALEQGLRLGRRFGAMGRAMQVLGDREAELLSWRSRTGLHRRAPDVQLDPVTIISSLDPPAAAAGWTSEVVDRAAARLSTARSGEPAEARSWESLPLGPDVFAIVSLPGRGAGDACRLLDEMPGATAALGRAGRVVCYDGRGTLDGAGPGLHQAILDLMALIHGFGDRNPGARAVEWPVPETGTAGPG
jgi:ABC-type hemin transport system substrate-binding protein